MTLKNKPNVSLKHFFLVSNTESYTSIYAFICLEPFVVLGKTSEVEKRVSDETLSAFELIRDQKKN